MSAAASTLSVQLLRELEGSQATDVTLLELVNAICDVTGDDEEVVATVLSLLRSGRVRLCGNFREAPLRDFC